MQSRFIMHSIVGVFLAALTTMAGCGGADEHVVGPPPIPATAVSGTAAKGIVKRAKVLVCRIVNGTPELDSSCAAGVTGADGSFSVTLVDGFTGPAMVKVMTNAIARG